MAVPLIIAGGLAAGGAIASAYGTASAQSAQNKVALQQAAAQSSQSFFNTLRQQGVNLQQLIAADPRGPDFWPGQYAIAKQSGEKGDFNTWLYKALQNAPNDPIWNAIANPAGTAGAANRTLPAWAVDAQGNPLQPSLLNQLVGLQSGANNPETAPINSLATLQNVNALLQAQPDLRQELIDAGVGSDGRPIEQWLVDHITQTEAASGGGTFTNALRTFLTTPVKDGGGATTTPAGPAGTGNNTSLDPAIGNLLTQPAQVVSNIFDDTYLKQIQAGLTPVAAARDAEAAAQLAKINEQRDLSAGVLNSSLAGLDSVLTSRTTGAGNIYDASAAGAQGVYGATLTGAGGIYDATAAGAQGVYGATLAGAGGVRDAATTAARDVYDTNVTKLADLLGVRREAAAAIYEASVGSAGGVRDARTAGARGIYDAELLQADTYGQAANQALSRSLAEQQAERARRGFTGGSSGSDITRARLNADYLQRGAGARAGAGVNLAGRLSDTGVGYATDIGRAGIGRASTVGAAQEADAQAKLQAAVQLANQLGLVNTNYAGTVGTAGINQATTLGNAGVTRATTIGTAGINQAATLGNAGVTRATTLAGAGEQDAIARLNAQVADATRRLGYLTADADIAKANADLKNAQDQLAAITNSQAQKIGSIGTPFTLAGLDLSLKDKLTDQQFAAWDAMMKRLKAFETPPAGGPTLTPAPTGPVANTAQIIGGGLQGFNSNMDAAAWTNLFKSMSDAFGGAKTTGSTSGLGLTQTPNFLSNTSVFQIPKG